MQIINSAREVLSGRNETRSPRVVSSKENYSALEMNDDAEDGIMGAANRNRCAEVGTAERDLQLAYARTTVGVTMRGEGCCKVEESVYGAAIVMPQLARTVGWNKTMATFAIQSWVFLILNVLLQAYLLKLLAKEEVVMDGFGGQMFLCDFGAGMEDCPGLGCRGPAGSQITAPRLYSWTAIVNRNFVKDSLKAVLPDKHEEIDKMVDPGEYGVESYWCRFACCFIFMMSCMGELGIIWKMVELLVQIPSKAESWILPRPKTSAEPMLGTIEEVQVLIAGMPLLWKLLNMVIVVMPKFMLWKLTAETGVTILMETSSIDDIITNSVGLTFILGLDELIGSALMQEETLNFVRACEDFDLYDKETSCVGNLVLLSDDELLQKYKESQFGIRALNLWDLINLLPTKLVVSILGTIIFVYEYYHKHCTENESDGGRKVSKSMYLPRTMHFSWLNAFLPNFFPIERSDTPYWSMPEGPS